MLPLQQPLELHPLSAQQGSPGSPHGKQVPLTHEVALSVQNVTVPSRQHGWFAAPHRLDATPPVLGAPPVLVTPPAPSLEAPSDTLPSLAASTGLPSGGLPSPASMTLPPVAEPPDPPPAAELPPVEAVPPAEASLSPLDFSSLLLHASTVRAAAATRLDARTRNENRRELGCMTSLPERPRYPTPRETSNCRRSWVLAHLHGARQHSNPGLGRTCLDCTRTFATLARVDKGSSVPWHSSSAFRTAST